MTNNPQVLGLSLLFGILPALLWLWFWLKEDKEKPEPPGLLFISFVMGMAAVILVIPAEKLLHKLISDNRDLFIIGIASIEEIFKLIAVSLIAFKSSYLDEPIDYSVYLITTALGFAALENALFLIEPITFQESTVGFLNGNLRFIGATLLHTITSGFIGIMLGFAFYKNKFTKRVSLIAGLLIAIGLHSAFNFFILTNSGKDLWKVFGVLWIFSIFVLFLLERLRRKPLLNRQKK